MSQPSRGVSMTEIAALVVAAGRGERAGGEIPKQYRPLRGQPILRRTLEALLRNPGIGAVQVMIGAGQEALFAAATAGLSLPAPALGGQTRQESVRRGLEALLKRAPDFVLIHDAARPLVSPAVSER